MVTLHRICDPRNMLVRRILLLVTGLTPSYNRDVSKKNHTLAEFLRAHRDKIQPEDVGLRAGGRRRVAGLRREEVAELAGISADYYHRIEQGRERPSDQVLDAIARGLRLTPDAAVYLRKLVSDPLHSKCSAEWRQPLNPALQALIDGWPGTPAHIHDVTTTMVMANRCAQALSPSFAVGESPLRRLFLDDQMREFYRDWESMTAWAVRWLRDYAGEQQNRELDAMIDELRTCSARFDQLWVNHDVVKHGGGLLLVNHPEVGPLDLHFQLLTLRGSDHIMSTYWADPGSPSEHALRRLALSEVC